MMLTSFEVMEAANISRATLNNYISQRLLPRPLVKNPEPGAPTSARQIGYFPKEVLARLERINQLKKDSYAMADIAKQLELEGFPMIGEASSAQEIRATQMPPPSAFWTLRLSICTISSRHKERPSTCCHSEVKYAPPYD